MNEIKPEELSENAFNLIGKDWFLVTAEKDNKVNMMTASWGGLGIIWNKNVATIYIRKSRYTNEFLKDVDRFSLCILPESCKNALGYCGKVSGRSENKVEKSGLTLEHDGDLPYFKESRLVISCRKLYAQEMNAQSFSENAKGIIDVCYSDNDWHIMYICEIEKITKL